MHLPYKNDQSWSVILLSHTSLTFLPINIILLPFFTPRDFSDWLNSVRDWPKTKKTTSKFILNSTSMPYMLFLKKFEAGSILQYNYHMSTIRPF